MKTKCFQHSEPIKEEANYIIGIVLEDVFEGYEYGWEQLWCKKIDDSHCIICCIPFFAYNISLDDEVVIDSDNFIKQVNKRSGQHTYRIWFGDTKMPEIRDVLSQELIKTGCLLEWYSNNLLAVSCSSQKRQEVTHYLSEQEKNGFIIYETGSMDDNF